MPVVYNRKNAGAAAATRYLEGRGQRETAARARRDDKQKQDVDLALRKPLQDQAPIANVTTQETPAAPAQTAVPTAPAAVPRQNNIGQRQVSELANVPGGGALATQMQQSQQKSSAKTEEQIWALLQKGESEKNPGFIEQAKYLNQQTNAGIPDYFFDDPTIRSQMTQIIGVARANSKGPRQIAATVQAALEANPELMRRIAMSQRAGRGIPEGLQAGAKVARGQEKDKARQARAKGGAQDRYPEMRIRLDLSKNFSQLKDESGYPLYKNEADLMTAVETQMRKLGYNSSVTKSSTFDKNSGTFR